MQKFIFSICFLMFAFFASGQRTTNTDKLHAKDQVIIGTGTQTSGVALDITDTDKGVLLPRMTTTQRNNLPNVQGLLIYNKTDDIFQYNNGGAWIDVGAGGDVVTISMLSDSLDLVVHYSDSITIFVTPSQLADSLASLGTGDVLYSDSLTVFVTPSQLADSLLNYATIADISLKVAYSDSLTVFVTPTQLETAIGDLVTGPAVAQDERIARYDGTTGKIIQTSNVAVTDAANITGVSSISMTGNINMVPSATVDGVDVSDLNASLSNYVEYADSNSLYITLSQFNDTLAGYKVLRENTLFVSNTDGDNATAEVGNVNRPWATIAQAFADASSGDLIYVMKGTYVESLNLGTKDLIWFFEPGTSLSNLVWNLTLHGDDIPFTTKVYGGNFTSQPGGGELFRTKEFKDVEAFIESYTSATNYDGVCALGGGKFTGYVRYLDGGGIYVQNDADQGYGYLSVNTMISHGAGQGNGCSLFAVAYNSQVSNAFVNVDVDTYIDQGDGGFIYIYGGASNLHVNLNIDSWVDDFGSPVGKIFFQSPSNSFYLNDVDIKLNIADAITDNELFNMFSYSSTHASNSDARIWIDAKRWDLTGNEIFDESTSMNSDFFTIKLTGNYSGSNGIYNHTGTQNFNLECEGSFTNDDAIISAFEFSTISGKVIFQNSVLDQSNGIAAIDAANASTVYVAGAFDANTIVEDPQITFSRLNEYGALPGVGLVDGDKGDITVTSSGTVWNIDSGVVTTTEISNGTITTTDMNTSTIVTAAEGLASSDNDTSFPTTAAVIDAIAAAGVSDSDYGDIAVTGGGTTWTLDTDAISVGAPEITNAAIGIEKIQAADIITQAEGIASNDNEITWPTSAAVKDYVDTQVGSITDTHIGNTNLTLPAATTRTLQLQPLSNFVLTDAANTNNRITFHLDGTGVVDDRMSIQFEHATAGNVTSDIIIDDTGRFGIFTESGVSIAADEDILIEGTTGMQIRTGTEFLFVDQNGAQDGEMILRDAVGTQRTGLFFEDNTGGQYVGLRSNPANSSSYILELPNKAPNAGDLLEATSIASGVVTTNWIPNSPPEKSVMSVHKTTASTTGGSWTGGSWTGITITGLSVSSQVDIGDFSFSGGTGAATWGGSTANIEVTFTVSFKIPTEANGMYIGISKDGASPGYTESTYSLPSDSGEIMTSTVTRIYSAVPNGTTFTGKVKFDSTEASMTFYSIHMTLKEL